MKNNIENYEIVSTLKDGYSIVKKTHKYGFINVDGSVVIPFLYDSIDVINNNVLLVSRGYQFETQIYSDYEQIMTKNYQYQIVFGCIDFNGNILIPLEFEELYINNPNYIRAVKNNKWGVINCRGVELISFEFDFIGEFENSIYLVGKKYYEDIKFPHGNRIKYGCIDSDERIIVPIEYEEIGKFNENGIAKAKKDEKYGLINKNGNIIAPFEYDEMKELIDGKIIVKKDYSNEINWEKLNLRWLSHEDYQEIEFSLWGVMDETGRVLYPIEYDEIKVIENDKIEAIKNGGLEFIMKNILNKDEKSTSNNKVNTSESNFTNSKSIKKGSKRFPKVNGQSIKSQIHINDKLILSLLNDKWGVINHNGEIIIPHQFKKIGKLINGIFKVTSNGYIFGYINELGNTIVPVEYARLGRFVNGKALACKSDNQKMKYGCIDLNGNVIIPFEYDKLSYFVDGKAIAQRKWDFVIIDEQNNMIEINEKIVLPFDYKTKERNLDGTFEFENHNFEIEINPEIEGDLKFYVIEDGERELTNNLFSRKGISIYHWGSEELEIRKIDFDDPSYFTDSEENCFSNNSLRDTFDELSQGSLGDYDKWRENGGDWSTLMAELGY